MYITNIYIYYIYNIYIYIYIYILEVSIPSTTEQRSFLILI